MSFAHLYYGKKKSTGGSGGTGNGGGGTVNNLEVDFSPCKYDKDTVSMNFALTFKNQKKDAFIGVFVESEVGLVDAKAWENDIGTTFPISVPIVANCKSYAVNSKQMITFDSSCSYEYRRIENDFTSIETVYTKAGNILGIKVKNTISNAIVTGTIVLASLDKKYCFTLKEAKE